MASANSEAVRTLAKEIVAAMRTLTDNNNRSYVNNEIKNYRMTSSNIGTSLYADFARIAAAQIGVAEIDTAQIRDLEATTIRTINLAAERARLGDVQVESLIAAISELGLANIGTANIGYGQIKDLVAGTAIIREGVDGKLFVDRLAVTDANMVSLTTGELMLKDTNGNFVRIIVDSETGEVSSEVVTFEGDNILDYNSMSATKIIENSITARELNVSSIFADQALIRAIKAANIDVADLFASRAFAGALYTNVIENPSIIIGDDGSHNVGTAIWSNTAPSDPEDGDTWVDTSALPYVFKEYQEDHWETIGELSSLKSAINITEDRIALIIDPDSEDPTELVLTDEMMLAIADKFSIIADDIDLSGNNSISAKINSQVYRGNTPPSNPLQIPIWVDTSGDTPVWKKYVNNTWVVVDSVEDLPTGGNEFVSTVMEIEMRLNEGITANADRIETVEGDTGNLKTRLSSAEAKITPDAITATVLEEISEGGDYEQQFATIAVTPDSFNTNVQAQLQDGTSELSQINQTASQINLVVASGSSAGHLTLTQDALDAVANKVDLMATDPTSGLYASLAMTSDKFETFVGNSDSISSISQTADKIDWIVSEDSTESSLSLTKNALNAIANDINLSANDSVTIMVGSAVDESVQQAREYTDSQEVGGRNYILQSKSLLNVVEIDMDIYQTGNQLHIISGTNDVTQGTGVNRHILTIT